MGVTAGGKLLAASPLQRICWTKPQERYGDCIRGSGMGGRKGGEGQAKLGRPVERERMWEGQTGMSSPNMRREILQARGVKQGGWLGYPRVDTPVPCRQAGSQADEGRVGQQSGLMRNPRPGKPCCSGGARGVGFARARGAPGHMGGKGLEPARSIVGSGSSRAEAVARLGEETQAPRATGGNAPGSRRDGGYGANRSRGCARSPRAG